MAESEDALVIDDRPILLLDVDGVLNAVTDTDPDTWETWRVDRSNGFNVRWSPDMIAALCRLAERVEIRWLTTWWNAIDKLAFLGMPDCLVANTRDEYFEGDHFAWWKLKVAKRIYAEGRRLIWIDDDLAFDEAAIEWGKSVPKGMVLGIAPATFRGITPQTIRDIEAWLDMFEEES